MSCEGGDEESRGDVTYLVQASDDAIIASDEESSLCRVVGNR